MSAEWVRNMNNKNLSLTEREYAIMEVLWENQKEMTINEISECSGNSALTVPCIAQIMPRLTKKGFVHVEHMISAKTKYARTFLPDVSREAYLEYEFKKLYRKTTLTGMLNMLVNVNPKNADDRLLDELDKYVKEQRRNQKEED